MEWKGSTSIYAFDRLLLGPSPAQRKLLATIGRFVHDGVRLKEALAARTVVELVKAFDVAEALVVLVLK